MSRIGKLLITIPDGVTVTQEGLRVDVKGPKGQLSAQSLPVVEVAINDGTVQVTRKNDSINARSAHGLVRQLIANMVTGVSTGFEKRLEMKGVGYRAAAEGDKKLTLSVGFSHPVIFNAPEGIAFRVEKNVIVISGIDKQLVGQIAAQIREVRPPEPYKGKGIMYQGEHVRRKAGKAAKAGG
jgi:large subunit ribosomal protein L6